MTITRCRAQRLFWGASFLWGMSSFLLALQFSVSSVVLAAAATSLADDNTDEIVLQCAGGWWKVPPNGVGGGNKFEDIPRSQINDGYCDCPLDGLDEPDTEACSGSASWPGVVHSPLGRESEGSDASPTTTPVFGCPQQSKLQLPLSRLHDGICDCCDGTDESSKACKDTCEEVLREERAARAKLEHDFEVGSEKRKHELEAFQSMRASKLTALEIMESKMKELELDVSNVQGEIKDLKQTYGKSRMATMKDEVVPGFQDLLSALSRSELEALIVHACQVAGEVLGRTQSDNTCVALRMAGLDLALTWSDDDYEDVSNMKGEAEMNMELINLLFENASTGSSLKWRTKKGSSGRRLDEILDDDTYHPDMEDEYRGYYGDDDYVPAYDELEDNPNSEKEEVEDEAEPTEGKEKELMDEVKASKLSSTRLAFLERSKQLIDEISRSLDASKDETKEEEGAVETEAESTEDETTSHIDPAAYTMVRNELRKTESSIRRGFHWATSARLLFAFSNQSDANLQRLAVGTLYYGQLSALQVWQILQSILPEYSNEEATSSIDTCASPWASNCPPKLMSRNGGTDNFPPSYILDVGQTFCDEQIATLNNAMAEACTAAQFDVDATSTPISVPTSIPDGYYGYTKPVARSEDDPLSTLFTPIVTLAVDKDGLETLGNKKRDLEKEKKDLQRDIDKGWKDIGGKEGNEMGEHGELYALADQCFAVDAGKYTYETCIFGKATQRDVGQSSGGTNLGNWKGASIDETTGRRHRVLKWDGGLKCWNGPQRSATVLVTCGAETKLISSDEPDTCRYVMEMESHIACDDAYRTAHGL